MNKFLIAFASIVYLLMSSSLLAQSTSSALSISFDNQTGSDIEYIPIISGDVIILDGVKTIVPPKHGDANIKLSKINRRSAIVLKQNGQNIARLNIDKKGHRGEVQICFVPALQYATNADDTTPAYKFKFRIPSKVNYKVGSAPSVDCTDWSGTEPELLLLTIDKAR